MPTEIFDALDMPATSATVIDRLKYLIQLSRRTQQQFATSAGVDPSNLSRILSGVLRPSDSFINKLVVNLGVSKEWLVSGTDVPFPREQYHSGVEHSSKTGHQSTHRGAPVYDIDATAGLRPLSRSFTQERVIGYVNLPGVNPENPVVTVSGDSMEPKIHAGSFISIRPVSLESPILWGNIYLVVLEDFRLVKYIRRHQDRSKVILHSANPNYDDMVIDISSIQALYLVELSFNYDIFI